MSDEGYGATFGEFDGLVGLDRIRAFHLNDSKKPLRQPRRSPRAHRQGAASGSSRSGASLNDPRFAGLPMLLETPKLDTPASRRQSDADPWDVRNLRTLRRLLLAL